MIWICNWGFCLFNCVKAHFEHISEKYLHAYAIYLEILMLSFTVLVFTWHTFNFFNWFLFYLFISQTFFFSFSFLMNTGQLRTYITHLFICYEIPLLFSSNKFNHPNLCSIALVFFLLFFLCFIFCVSN